MRRRKRRRADECEGIGDTADGRAAWNAPTVFVVVPLKAAVVLDVAARSTVIILRERKRANAKLTCSAIRGNLAPEIVFDRNAASGAVCCPR